MTWKAIEARREYFRKRRRLAISKLQEYKKQVGWCQYCGYSEHPEILLFHHRNKEEKKFRFAGGGNLESRSQESIDIEMKKCDLICPNCHAWVHFNEKEWFVNIAKTNYSKK